MSALRIAIDARLAGGAWTGDSSYWTGLLHGLSELDADARFLLFSNVAKPAGIPNCDKFEWIELSGGNQRWWSVARFPLEARKRRASVIQTQYNLSPLAGRIGITTLHDVSFFIGPEWFRRKDLFLLRRFVPQSARRAARVLTVSETSRGDIERFIPAARGKTVVTPLACPLHIQPNGPEVARALLGHDEPYLLTVGTRWPRKNMQLAVDAARLSGFRLVVTGKPGWGEEKFEGVQAVGYVDSETLSSLYSAASLYLAPSRHEGFGLPLLEAFRCGCPVLCSSGGALPEVAAAAAVVMPTWDPQSWAEAIQKLMNDSSKLNELRNKGRERVSQFSWRETARLTMAAYEDVARANA